jgi:uncharacterized membrane protein YphA (DoxX/SURF4 family)
MNIVLWILQGLLATSFLSAGVSHAFSYERARARRKWVKDVSRPLLAFIGKCEILGAVGLILPALTGILPWLAPLAAFGLATIMILAAAFHARRREYPDILVNLILLALAALIVYGRWVLVPL